MSDDFQYLACYHSDNKNINNYEFIFRIQGHKIDKVIYLSNASRDTIYIHNYLTDLIGMDINKIVLSPVYNTSVKQYITRETLQQLAKHIIMNDPLLAEAADT
jgi:hypothetical protein